MILLSPVATYQLWLVSPKTGRSTYIPTGVQVIGSSSNGMKLAFEFLLYQLLTQYLPGFDH
jgi:hypothetical protein